MSEYAWLCQNKLDFEYASGPKYAKSLNMVKFSIRQCSQYASVLNMPEYALTEFCIYLGFSTCKDSEYGRVLNEQELHRVLNMPKCSWICLNTTWICLNMSEFTIIERVLNMYHTIHSARSLYKLMSTCWEIGLFRTW